ncbi:MAG: amino acid carrier protein [Oscillospiraceae bacterium]|nr:amino acid carrier protein [Oscillospiraceae bacterium]
MQWLKSFNDQIIWGIPMLILLLGTGIFLSLRTGFVQIFEFKYAMRHTLGKIFRRQMAEPGAMTPFQAMTTALAATAGTGNIAGITYAVTLGGAGAVFWLWISALIGMCTKYAETVLAVKFRTRNPNGEFAGGPMYYIRCGLSKRWHWLSVLFCIFGAAAAFGIGNAVQVGNMTSAVNHAISAFTPAFADHRGIVNLVIGICVATFTGMTLLRGIKALGRMTEMIVPLMSIIYLGGALIVIFANIGGIVSVFADIFTAALTPRAAIGGAAGISMRQAVSVGLKRGVFSNEAGLGSAPIAHAASSEKDPVKQGLYGIFEVFIDTIIMGTITALTLLLSGLPLQYGTEGGVELNMLAFSTVFGERAGAAIISACMVLFALATVLGWSFYGVRCCEYLFGPKSVKPYLMIYVFVTILGATMDISLAWEISDTLNGLMAIPNLIALLALSGIVVQATREHFGARRL